MHFDIENLAQGGVIIKIGSDTLDFNNVKDFKQEIHPLLGNQKLVLLDMQSLKFVDSSGLGALLSVLRTVNDGGGELKLYEMTKPVRALFELVRMHRIFAIYNTLDEALASI
jgi:anti-sigma B factor antagonist